MYWFHSQDTLAGLSITFTNVILYMCIKVNLLLSRMNPHRVQKRLTSLIQYRSYLNTCDFSHNYNIILKHTADSYVFWAELAAILVLFTVIVTVRLTVSWRSFLIINHSCAEYIPFARQMLSDDHLVNVWQQKANTASMLMLPNVS